MVWAKSTYNGFCLRFLHFRFHEAVFFAFHIKKNGLLNFETSFQQVKQMHSTVV